MNYTIIRGGDAENQTFGWVKAPLKNGCVCIERVLGFKYLSFHFWALGGAVCRVLSSFWLLEYRHSPPTTI